MRVVFLIVLFLIEALITQIDWLRESLDLSIFSFDTEVYLLTTTNIVIMRFMILRALSLKLNGLKTLYQTPDEFWMVTLFFLIINRIANWPTFAQTTIASVISQHLLIDYLNLIDLRINKCHPLFPHFFNRFNFFLLIMQHLYGLCHPKLDGIRWISHIMNDHIHEYLVILKLLL